MLFNQHNLKKSKTLIMKIKGYRNYYAYLVSTVVLSIMTFISFAQDSTSGSASTTQTTTTTHTAATIQPWMWIVGAVVLLLIILALVRGKSSNPARTDSVTYTKTTRSSDDV